MTDRPAFVWRVQDADGRGPYKPGMSCRWADPDGADNPTVMQEFGMEWVRRVPAGWAGGCAFESLAQAGAWFSPHECARLDRLGYRLVMLTACVVLCRSRHQLVVTRPIPLRVAALPVAWPHLAAGAVLSPFTILAQRETQETKPGTV